MLDRFCRRTAHFAIIAPLALLFGALCPLAGAQPPSKSPNGLPDIVGLYPGMPVADAYNLLKRYFPNRGGNVDVHQDTIQGLNADKPLATKLHIPAKGQQDTYDDLIDVLITLPPNKQAVWAVNRTIFFDPSKAPSAAALIAGLRQKYGPEMHVPSETRPNPPVLRWIFDRQGKRVADDFARKCNQPSGSIANGDGATWRLIYNPSDIQNANLTAAPAGVPGAELCKTFVYMEANVSSNMNDVANSLILYVFDLGMAVDAGLRTEAVIRGVANADAQKAQEQQKDRDKKAVPTF